MHRISRRQLLTFLGATTASLTLGPTLGRLTSPHGGQVEAAWPGHFTPVRLPHPLPIYTTHQSYLARPGGTSEVLPPAADPSLATYEFVDDVVVPPEFEWYVIVRWGDRVFPDPDQYVGYNHDYTAFIPLHGRSDTEWLLWVNHEYVSFPFSALAPEAPANLAGLPTSFEPVVGFALPGHAESRIHRRVPVQLRGQHRPHPEASRPLRGRGRRCLEPAHSRSVRAGHQRRADRWLPDGHRLGRAGRISWATRTISSGRDPRPRRSFPSARTAWAIASSAPPSTAAGPPRLGTPS